MATGCIAHITLGFEREDKPVVAAFDMPDVNSDGGTALPKGIDTQVALTKRCYPKPEDWIAASKMWANWLASLL